MESVIVVGAGPVGCATALGLAQRGYNVSIYESKSDPRINRTDGLRSINLAISARGLNTLEKLSPQITESISQFFVPMGGRMVHDPQGKQTGVAYGLHGESIQSISRARLNDLLLDQVIKSGIPIHFDNPFKSLVAESRLAQFNEPVHYDIIIGCDGTYSKVRHAMTRLGDYNYSQEYIEHYYLEVPITAGADGKPIFHPNYLHIWPRKHYMFIALANTDGTMTGTLFAPKQLFAQLDTTSKFIDFFKAQFPDAFDHVGEPALRNYFETYPKGKLLSNKVFPYHFMDEVIVLGDAAHSMVPFYGQGLNCGLEDVSVLLDCFESTSSRAEAFEMYSNIRKPDLDAILQLSMNNYTEMRSSVTKKSFFFRKWIDGVLCKTLGDRWLPLYTMISFRADIPYSAAIKESVRQTEALTLGLTTTAAIAAATVGIFGYKYFRS